ncbi:hypothetical protein F5B21DRAFT_458868 [Xylaria acuta]|nr:hypothetical protein F5B21DRAFT_458868 [Xylaria acuta]
MHAMTFNTNAFWGCSDSDTFRCYTPPTPDSLNNPPDWDGFFDFQESIDPTSSLELLQGPLPCTYEPHDEWLADFKQLQDVRNRASAVNAATISTPPQHERDIFTASHIGSYQPETRQSHSSRPRCHSRVKFSKNAGPAYVQDKTGRASPISTRYSSSADGRSPGFYDWNSPSAYDNQQNLGGLDVQRAIKGLREIEQNLQADTKRRMSQIQQSRPG